MPSEKTCDLRIRFASNLKACRILLGISVYKMAHDLNVNTSYIYRLEDPRYNINPSFEMVEKIANYLDVSPSIFYE